MELKKANNEEYNKIIKSVRGIGVMSVIFSWITILPDTWNIAWILTVICIVSYSLTDSYLKKLRRAYSFHLAVFLLTVPHITFLILTSLWLLQKANVPDQFFVILSGVTIAGFFIAIPSYKTEFDKTMNENIETNRLNPKLGQWDLSAPLVMYSKLLKNKINYLTGLRRLLSPFTVALGFYLARNLEGDRQLFLSGFLLFLIGSFILWNNTYQLAIAIVLRNWEKLINKDIELVMQ